MCSDFSFANVGNILLRRNVVSESKCDSAAWAYGFSRDDSWIKSDATSSSDQQRDPRLEGGDPFPFYFWHRQSPGKLTALKATQIDSDFGYPMVTEVEPTMYDRDCVNVRLDCQGKLVRFLAFPSAPETGSSEAGSSREFDWTDVFDKAELDFRKFKSTNLRWYIRRPKKAMSR